MLKQSTWSSSKSLRPFWASKYSSDVICLESFSPTSLFWIMQESLFMAQTHFQYENFAKSICKTQHSEMTQSKLSFEIDLIDKMMVFPQSRETHKVHFVLRTHIVTYIFGHVYSDKTFHERIRRYLFEKQNKRCWCDLIEKQTSN